MRRKRYYRKKRRGRKRGREIPYIYKNQVYLRKRPQTGSGVLSKFVTKRWRLNWTLMKKI